MSPESLMDCKTFQRELPDLVLTPGAIPSPAAAAHLRACPPCSDDYLSFQQTFAALDTWKPVEPSPYFDSKLSVRLRESQAEPAMSWLERLRTRLLFNTGRSFRPALAGSLALVLAVGGGSIAGFHHAAPAAPEASATVQDLQILDRNEQAFQEMDLLQQQDDDNNSQTDDIQQSPTT